MRDAGRLIGYAVLTLRRMAGGGIHGLPPMWLASLKDYYLAPDAVAAVGDHIFA